MSYNWDDNGDEMPAWRHAELDNQLWADRRARMANMNQSGAQRVNEEWEREQERQRLLQAQAERRERNWRTVGWTAYVLLLLTTLTLVVIGVTVHPDLDGSGKYLMIAMIVGIFLSVIITGAIIA